MSTTCRVLFVCTGNTFRSLIAEYCLAHFLKTNAISGISVSSAGTVAQPAVPDPRTIAELNKLGIHVSHRQRKLTRSLLRESDLVIAMAKDHQDFIRENFGESVPLFLEITKGIQESVYDGGECPRCESIGGHISETVTLINSLVGEIPKRVS